METQPPKRNFAALFIVAVVVAAIAGPLGGALALRVEHRNVSTPGATAVAEHYQCPMHPEVIQDHPGNCPICGMKLLKVAAAPKPLDSNEAHSEVDGLSAVDIDASRQKLIGLTTGIVDRGVVGGAFTAVGRVSVDETQVRRISVKTPGYVEHVFVDFLGKPVRQGQALFSFYSPDILAAENEYLVALSTRAPGQEGRGPLEEAARRKLSLWDVPDTELQRIEREKTVSKTVTFVSPVSGVVTKKDLVEGARLETGAMPYEVVDLSTVWVLAEIYESELRFVTPGVAATLRLNAYPDRAFSGKVLFVDPLLDPQTRTARVRLAFPNPRAELKPELFGEVKIERPAREVLRLPTDALIHNGTEEIVFVVQGQGHFEPRRVQVGETGRDFAEVLSGLSEGQTVVTRANFLVDSESRLRASLKRASSSAAPIDAGSVPSGAERPGAIP